MKGAPLWMLAGALAFYVFAPVPAPSVDYPRVFVHREAIEQLEPKVEVRFVERIKYVIPKPLQVATAIGGGKPDVIAFCAPTVQGDTSAADPMLLLRSGSLERGWPLFGADQLRLTGPTSTGDLVQSTYRTRGSVSFRTVGDSVLVRYDRWRWAKDAGTAAGIFLIGRASARIF
jgi:hypothetical protein